MIAVIIYYLHTLFAIFIFARTFQKDGLLQAILNIAFIVIIFTVGWTITDVFVGLIVSDQGYLVNVAPGSFLNGLLRLTGFYEPLGGNMVKLTPKDSVALIVITVVEVFFYRFFFSINKQKRNNQPQSQIN
ncbi:MAG: hypothetical protein JW917_01490 [Ignavibacteria bacterium]|nr:hypothetical protein [Ignavibacteria bacterium]